MSDLNSNDIVLRGIDPRDKDGAEFQISPWLWPPMWGLVGAFGGITSPSPLDAKILFDGVMLQPGFTVTGASHQAVRTILEKAQEHPKVIDAARNGYPPVDDISKMIPGIRGGPKPAFDGQKFATKLGEFINFLRKNGGFRYDGLLQKTGDTVFCVKCGIANNISANFCFKCGSRLIHPPNRPASNPPSILNDTSNLRLQSELLLVQGRFQEALTYMDQLIPQLSNDASFWNNRGAAQAKLGQHEEAIKSFDRALQVDPHHINALLSKSLALANLGRFEDAIACCDKIIEFNPKFAMAWMNKGNFFLQTGRLEEAVECSRKAMNYDIKNPNAWYGLANAYEAIGNHEGAELAMKQALKLVGKRPNF